VCAFFERCIGYLHILEFHFAARALAVGIWTLLDGLDLDAAVWQNFVPANIIPMQWGQATVCNRAWQY